MERKSWVLVGFFSNSTCSFALAGRSVLRDSRSSFTPVFRRSTKPTDLPFFPFPLFSSGIVELPFFRPVHDASILAKNRAGQAPSLQFLHRYAVTLHRSRIVTPARMIPDH